LTQKYRQHGYKDGEYAERGTRKPAPQPSLTPEERAQQRSLKHALNREANEVVRCPDCGRNIPSFGAIGFDTSCPHCNAPLHSCRACKHFDTAARFECRVNLEARVPEKGKANACGLYEARLVLDATGRRTGTAVSGDPKSAFDSLFKK
jgi:hypothetical protein